MAQPPKRYSEQAAKEILKRAIDLQGDAPESDFSQEQLAEMARDLGISTDALARAEQTWLAEQQGAEERRALAGEQAAFERDRQQAFRIHAAVYVAVNVFLFLLNAFGTGGLSEGNWWFFYPLLGWGLGLTIHAISLMQKEGMAYEQQFNAWRSQRGLRQGNRHRLP